MKSETESNSATSFADAPPSYDNAARIVAGPSKLPNNAGRGEPSLHAVVKEATVNWERVGGWGAISSLQNRLLQSMVISSDWLS